ncbi:sirohydrochlorin ferrochelatase [Sediminihabitans luteus]|uniref:Sirohydrochlorin ferrochelatase n=1 Tax=Sediminihabitans luteus TaxID=1138585 RepID=A0A2M9D0W3_9CELL|nr:CbiX/SirB N-terminal domain-containing protein [Sediminihabitans luteus]PJJ77733.1 sirohydrochlorin ferrochelatase [Sediminihabitans luteus]GIJ00040.1 hypothetical protein Slu03_24170 [Sediminihabitans luteus]
MRTQTPVLVGCSHGTADPAGQAAIRALLDDVRAARPALDVREAFVDVQQPEVGDVVSEVVLGGPASDDAGAGVVNGAVDGAADDAADAADGATVADAVVVPLLLSAGFHVHVDVTEAVASRGADAGAAVRTAALGPDARLVEILRDRLDAAGLAASDTVVLAAAGSSDERASRDVEAVRDALAAAIPQPVVVGYGSMARPSVREAVAAAREAGAARVVVASYLLAPGFFLDRLREAGADVVSDALAPDPRLTAVVLDRYDAGVEALPALAR